jgi:L-ascorbate metabolism protein UlaG (beta-lactamase superfamily)
MEEIQWLGHSSFKIRGKGRVIYIDPYRIIDHEPADFIFITHPHTHHYSLNDLKKIAVEKTNIYAPSSCIAELELLPGWSLAVEPESKFTAGNLEVTSVPAYNTGSNVHPREEKWTGFIIDFGGMRVYHSGDTDLIPEMSSLEMIDYALLPVSGGNVMDAEDAARAANIIKPSVVIPMHYIENDKSRSDIEHLKSLYPGEVRVLKSTW